MNAQCLITIWLMLATISPGQNILSGTIEPAGSGRKLVATFDGPPRSLAAVVRGAPYTAEQVKQRTLTLSDGSHIIETLPSHWMYRDSQGRRRMESWILTGPDGEPGIHIVEIRDFVAGYEYTLDPENRVAHRMRIPADNSTNTVVIPVEGPLPSVGVVAASDRPRPVTESLGTRMIEGSLANGRRVTTTIPLGLQGNDKALVSISETWIAQDLKLVILSKQYSLKDGETVTKLINITHAEPDPALFQVPTAYRLVDEEGRFTIEVTRSRGDVRGSREDEESIRKLLAGFADARNAFDAQGMAAAFAEDAEFIPLDGPPRVGRQAIERDWISHVIKVEGRMERSVKSVRFIRPDVAVVEGDVHFRGPHGSMDFLENYMLRKDAGRWQILFHRYIDPK